jgi:hypothetical protein
MICSASFSGPDGALGRCVHNGQGRSEDPFKANALFGRSPFEPLMAVWIKLQTPTADFDEALTPIGVIQIEVIVVGQDRFVAREFKDGPFIG